MTTRESGHRLGLDNYIGTRRFFDLEQQAILFLSVSKKIFSYRDEY